MSTFSLTNFEQNAYWEGNLGASHTLSSIEILSEESVHGLNGLQDYYILFSRYPFTSDDLGEQLTADCVTHINIENSTSNNRELELNNIQAQFVRIQTAGPGIIGITGVNPWGIGEWCGDGTDNDGDCLVDCDDPDCGVSIFNTVINEPTCPNCNDGSVTIQAFSGNGNVQISSDNGEGFSSCQNICNIENLGEGIHSFILSNGNCETIYSVSLMAPRGGADESECENGGFESGNYEDWGTQFGFNFTGGSPITFNDVDEEDLSGFGINIIQSGTISDPNLGGQVLSPTGGTYVSQIGSSPLTGGLQARRIENCFLVTSANADFAFNYALVLEEPGADHTPAEKPYFQYNIIVQSTGNEIKTKTIRSEDDEQFDVQGDIQTKNWTCETVDLTNYIGQEVCIEFIIADCSRGEHGAYAYIDAICQDREDSAPVCDFNSTPTAFCDGNFPLILNTDVNNFTQYTINLCGGNTCSDNEPTLSFNFPEDGIDIGTLANEAGIVLREGELLSLEVSLENDCGSCTSNFEFVYQSTSISLDYPDEIIHCRGQELITIPGDIDCENCTISWSPDSYLIDPESPNPTINGEINLNALNEDYTVTVTETFDDGTECSQSHTVSVKNFEERIVINCDHTNYDHCTIDLVCTATFPEPTSVNEVNITVIDANNNGNSIILSPTNLSPNVIEFTATIDRDQAANLLLESYIEFVQFENANTDFCVLKNTIGTFPKSNFSRPWKGAIPNAFSPHNEDGVNDLFYPILTSPSIKNDCSTFESPSSVYYLKLKVFDVWGNLVHEEEVELPRNAQVGLNGSEVAWDGKFRGQKMPSDVYVYVAELKWCTTDNSCPGGSSNNNVNNLGSIIFNGDFTLIN